MANTKKKETTPKKTAAGKSTKTAAARTKVSKPKKAKSAEGFLGKASLRNFRCSPRKARLVVNLVRGQRVDSALDILANCEKKTGPAVKKLLLSAVANVQNKESGVDVDTLYVKRIWVGEGLKFYRFMPRAQGRATPIRKRSSNIEIELDER